MSEPRIQHRAICPACFHEQAVKGDRMVLHAYSRPQWGGYQTRGCAGERQPHFGTPEGRDYAADYAAALRDLVRRAGIRAEELKPAYEALNSRYPNKGTPERLIYDEYVSARDTVRMCTTSAIELEAAVAAWKPKAPRAVKVMKAEPVMHAVGYTYMRSGHKLCATSNRAAFAGAPHTTLDRAAVTCTRCIARLHAQDVRAENNALRAAAQAARG